jgi:methyl-accepting chemotaxis protein
MDNTASTSRTGSAAQASAGELVKQMSEQVSRLVRDEMRLAQLEMTRKGKQAGAGLGLAGMGGVLALYAGGALLACAIIALSGVLAAWLAALIVGAALAAAAAAAALAGKGRLSKAMPAVPEQAIGNVKADVEEIREKAHR